MNELLNDDTVKNIYTRMLDGTVTINDINALFNHTSAQREWLEKMYTALAHIDRQSDTFTEVTQLLLEYVTLFHNSSTGASD
jgi:hypothetical protein